MVLGDEMATYAGTDENGDVILHLEDGSCKKMPTEEIINHLNQDQDTKEIDSIVGHQWAPLSGKLMLKVKSYTDEESLIDAELLREDNPMMVAQYILNNPMERTRSGYWNKWAQITMKEVVKTVRRLRNIYENFTDLVDLPFRKARRIYKRKENKQISNPLL